MKRSLFTVATLIAGCNVTPIDSGIGTCTTTADCPNGWTCVPTAATLSLCISPDAGMSAATTQTTDGASASASTGASTSASAATSAGASSNASASSTSGGISVGATTTASSSGTTGILTTAGHASATTSSTSGSGTSGASWSACHTLAPYSIDATESEWAGVASLLIPYTDAIVAPTSPAAPTSNAQLSATVQAAWNSTTLYVMVQVTDPAVVAYASAPYIFDNDSVELYLDGTDSKLPAYDAGDYQLTVTAFNAASDAGFQHAALLTDGGYAVEFGVPFSLLGANAGSIGFDVAINANDGGAIAQRLSQLLWSGDGGAYLDPQQFGQLRLDTNLCAPSGGGGL